MKVSKNPTTVVTANGEVQTIRKEATEYVMELDLFVTVMRLEETPAVLPLRKLCEDHGYNIHSTSGQKPHLIKMAGRSIAIRRTTYHSLSLVYREALQALFTCSSSQETVTPTERKLVAWTSRNRKHFKNDDNEEVRGNSSHDLPEWLEEFKDNLVDGSVPEDRDASSSSHELPSEPRAKVVSGKHSIFNFPKDRNCDICLRTKITRASCRKRTGTVVPREENFGGLITADHKSSWRRMRISKQSSIRCSCARLGNTVDTIMPMYNENFPGDPEEPDEGLGADDETKSHLQ